MKEEKHEIRKKLILRSKKIQEILNEPPAFIVRVGTVMITLLLVIIAAVAYVLYAK